MTAFRFIFPDDEEEGFEVLEENEASADDDEEGFEVLEVNKAISADDDEDDQEEPTQINNEDDLIWETEED